MSSTPKIDPTLVLYGAAGLALLYLTYKSTDAASVVYTDLKSVPGSVFQSISNGASSLWNSVTDLWGPDPQYADITKSSYTPTQVQKILPAKTVQLADNPATSPTFGGIANGDSLLWVSDPSTRIGSQPVVGWGSSQTFSGA